MKTEELSNKYHQQLIQYRSLTLSIESLTEQKAVLEMQIQRTEAVLNAKHADGDTEQ